MAQNNQVTYSVFDSPSADQKYKIYDGGPSKLETVAKDFVKSLPGAIPRAAAGLVGAPQGAMDLASQGVTKAINFVGDLAGIDAMRNLKAPTSELPNAGEVVQRGYDAISQVATGSPVYRPQTGPGRVADMTAQVLVGGPGSLIQKGVSGLSAGLGGEAGRAAGIENPIALGVLQMVAGAVPGLVFALRSVPSENINRALSGVTEQQLTAAQKLMDDARRMGTPLTGAEALAQVTGRNLLQDIQRVVEASPDGGPKMQQVMNARPANNRQAFDNAANQIGPMLGNPGETAARVQGAATKEIKQLQTTRTALTSPYYDQQRTQDLSAIRAAEALPAEQQRLAAIEASRGSAVQQGGRLTSDANTLRIQAENPQVAVPGYPRVPGRILNYPERLGEATAAADQFKAAAAQRAAEAGAQRGRVGQLEAAANIPLTQQVQDRVRGILANIDDQIAVVGVTSDEGKALTALRNQLAPNGEPIKYASQLESVHKSNKKVLNTELLNPSSEQLAMKGVIGKFLSPLDDAIKEVSPAIREGRRIYGEISERMVSPVERGTVGDLSRIPTGPGTSAESGMARAGGILMPDAPKALAPPAIRDTVARLNRQDPGVARDFVRQNLQSIFDEATQKLQSGENQWGGARFNVKVAGNAQQRDNLQALVEASAGRQAWVGFNRFLEVLEAQGKRQASGSQTAQNELLRGDLSSGGVLTAAKAVVKPSTMANAYERFRYGKDTAQMADILTDQKSIELMKQLAKEAPMSARASLLATQILAGQQPSAISGPSNTGR
jgi:hypothetical protein